MSKVAIVTGASRGAGAGIARALGAAGMTVYVTGRTAKAGTAPLPGTIHDTAAAIDAAGGKGIAVRVDHSQDEETKLARSLLDIYVYKDMSKVDKAKPSSGMDPVPILDPLAYVVKPPGKVIETNGKISKDGRVYWGLVPLATAKHDIVLTVLCEPGP